MAPSMLRRVQLVYAAAGRLVGFPYKFAGGHNSAWEPSLYFAQGIEAPGAGYDCSSALSIILRAGGMCWDPRPPLPLATGNFMEWGEPGMGAYMTVHVRNDSVAQHCGVQFSTHHFEHEWWQAANPRDGIGWFTLDTTGMVARHWRHA